MVKPRKTRRRQPPGTPPGTLTVPEGAKAPKISLMAYDADQLVERTVTDLDEIAALRGKYPMIWINVDGLGSIPAVEKMGGIFGLHSLALEDVMNLHQRAKTENYNEYLFIALRMAHWRNENIATEQMTMFVGPDFVLTFQEDCGDSFDPVRARLRSGKSRRVRFLNADYLTYALIDAAVDEYFPILEMLGDRLDALEEEVVARPQRGVIAATHTLKRELQQMRHAMWPMREMINGFAASHSLVHEETRPYLRDCHDHIIQVLDMLETYRERASGLVDIYLSSISNRMNEVMQVLTVIATIFMPLSFIASVYGMNFDTSSPWNMPELKWRYGYPFALLMMAIVAGVMLFFFRRRGWLVRRDKKTD
jgi:magnesium transporter